MANQYEITTRTVNLVNNEASATIPKGTAVTWAGLIATTHVGFCGVNRFECEPGEPMTAVLGRVYVEYNGTPGAGVELAIHTDGTFDAAIAGDVVVGTQAEVAVTGGLEPGLGIAAIEGNQYIKA